MLAAVVPHAQLNPRHHDLVQPLLPTQAPLTPAARQYRRLTRARPLGTRPPCRSAGLLPAQPKLSQPARPLSRLPAPMATAVSLVARRPARSARTSRARSGASPAALAAAAATATGGAARRTAHGSAANGAAVPARRSMNSTVHGLARCTTRRSTARSAAIGAAGPARHTRPQPWTRPGAPVPPVQLPTQFAPHGPGLARRRLAQPGMQGRGRNQAWGTAASAKTPA